MTISGSAPPRILHFDVIRVRFFVAGDDFDAELAQARRCARRASASRDRSLSAPADQTSREVRERRDKKRDRARALRRGAIDMLERSICSGGVMRMSPFSSHAIARRSIPGPQ
jgi:hypothetical protein